MHDPENPQSEKNGANGQVPIEFQPKHLKLFFKPQYRLRNDAALLARYQKFKTIADIRANIIVKYKNPDTNQEFEIEDHFKTDQEFLDHICMIELNKVQFLIRLIYRICSLNGNATSAYFKMTANYSNPATLAVLTTILHSKDVFSVATVDNSNSYSSFFKSLGASLGIILVITVMLQLFFDLVYYVYRIKNYRNILRITRFEQLQRDYDTVNMFSDDWSWAYNYTQMDPDLAMLYYQYKWPQAKKGNNSSKTSKVNTALSSIFNPEKILAGKRRASKFVH